MHRVMCGHTSNFLPMAARPLSPHRDIFLPSPTPEGIEKFKALYLEKFGTELSPQAALELATRTLHFVYLATTPCPVMDEADKGKAEEG